MLCFSMDFNLTDNEEAELADITAAAYNAWVLVNDYFSWDKELLNHQFNNREGEIVSAIFLYMKWYSIDAKEAKVMLKAEIMEREKTYDHLKNQYLARGNATARVKYWFELLDLVTAGNFAWSMTTARYNHNEQDAYPGLRAKHYEEHGNALSDDLDEPIWQRLGGDGHNDGQDIGAKRTDSPMMNSEDGDAFRERHQFLKNEPSLDLPGGLMSPHENVSFEESR